MQISCKLISHAFSASVHPEHKPQAKEGILAIINEELRTESLLLLIYNASPAPEEAKDF